MPQVTSSLPLTTKDLKGILIGGPSPTKEEFYAGEFLHHELLKKILGLFDIAYTDESGLSELVNAAGEKLQDLELMGQKNAVKAFFKELDFRFRQSSLWGNSGPGKP